MNYCVVGDVHGEYNALINLVAKTPRYSQLIFVGDLVDRGSQSAHVVRFVREHKLACVKGNHEVMMIDYGSEFIEAVKNNRAIQQDNIWLKSGGIETLISYDLVSISQGKMVAHPFIKDFIFQFEDDIEWMKRLPLYLDLDVKHASGRKVVVSHSAIASVWNLKESAEEENIRKFSNIVLWGRIQPLDSEPIFNIFGHTPQRYAATIHKHYVNIDTGCYMKQEKGFGLLSAYCVGTGEVYASTDLNYEKVS
ncbi:MAG: Serine/threonine protein phosphatase [uncultured Sulfurovum sp.]|uniref:Serine/threonine protein phosphatase n=1 Tax=uncultured Sulfurovum sp. TaxID=269237 RepID=A0A6S6TG28_9BACT|nr:MAG: Serine/threonine protein phosphatase [uncultured Sulfurovum sp.]